MKRVMPWLLGVAMFGLAVPVEAQQKKEMKYRGQPIEYWGETPLQRQERGSGGSAEGRPGFRGPGACKGRGCPSRDALGP